MKTAKFLKQRSKGPAVWRHYQLSEPLEGTEFVVVSASVVPFGAPETYIFPADAAGEVTDWGELDGSYRGGLDHEKALRNAGYDVAPVPTVLVEEEG